MKTKFYLNFYGVWASVYSPSEELISKLSLDFDFFLHELGPKHETHFVFEFFLKKPPAERLPKKVSQRQSLNSLTFDQDRRRFNDYHGRALSIYDYEIEKGEIYSLDFNKLHELSYLMILSRIGKTLDLKGLHKIHAFSVAKEGQVLIGMMPMKGGKSTLFKELIKDREIEMISDDSPLISLNGEVYAFPIRIGFEERVNDLFIQDESLNTYTLEREKYGTKHLISTRGLVNRIYQGPQNKIILFVGQRANHDECIIESVSKIKIMPSLIINLVIGVGLPVIFEYFWEHTWRDFFIKSRIALQRLYTGLRLLIKSQTYRIELGRDIEKNAKVIKQAFLSTGGNE